jgi:hypothetical protein
METRSDPDTVKEGENGAFGRDARFHWPYVLGHCQHRKSLQIGSLSGKL